MSIFENGGGNGVNMNIQTPWQESLRERIHPENLPIGQKREEILTLLDDAWDSGNNIALIQGETGSGKSVLLPGMLREKLKAKGLPVKTLVIQPRRDAAKDISRAISAVEQLSWGERGVVGCSTSETKEVGAVSEIPVVTTGIALRYLSEMLQKSRDGEYVSEFGAIMIDEFHENSVEYHLIMGIVKMLREKGKAPFVLLTSATLEKEKTQEYYGMTDDQYLRVEGRTYPVEVTFASEKDPEAIQKENSYIQETAEKVQELLRATREGDVLVFMPGVREINATIRAIGEIDNVEVLALHGAQTDEERKYAREPVSRLGVRRVIVATNIAETSLTLPRIVAVVDSCRRRSVRYNPETGIYERGTEFISQDSAKQRAGRAGRVQAGVCKRLATESEWEEMPEHTVPEIKQTNLSHVVLKLRGLDIDPEEFPFIDPPDKVALQQAEKQLALLGALGEKNEITPIGRRMLDMPFFEPSIARMVVEAEKRGCVEQTLPLAILERESAIFYMPSQREIFDEQMRLLEGRGYSVVRGRPPKLSLSGIKLEKSDVDRLLSETRYFAQQNLRDDYAQKQRVFGDSSDWLRNMNVFSSALKQGVMDVARHQRTPAGQMLRQEFSQWCKEIHVNERALVHVAAHITDYARILDIPLDTDTLKTTLDSTNWNDMSMVILAGHPHMLLYKSWQGGGMPEYSFFQGQSEKGINVSPGSVTFHYPPEFCIATKIHEGKGTISGREIKRNYASGIHPVTIAQIMEMFPHLVEKKEGQMIYDDYEKQVLSETIFFLKNQPDVILERMREPASPEVAKEFLARMPYHSPERMRDASPLIYQETPRTPEELQRLEVLKKRMEENNDRIEAFFQRVFELNERFSLLAPFNLYEINSLESQWRSIRSQIRNDLSPADVMERYLNLFFSDLEGYERDLQDFEAKNGTTNNAIAQALQKARGEPARDEETPVVRQELPSDNGRVLSKKKIEKVSEIVLQSTLPDDIRERINALLDPEARALLIMEEQQEIRKKLKALEGESQELLELVASADELSEEHKRWKKEEHALDKTIKALTQRKEDKQKEASLRLQRRTMADEIRKIEEKLKSARSAKSKAADFVKAKSLLEAQLQELATMEEDALKNI